MIAPSVLHAFVQSAEAGLAEGATLAAGLGAEVEVAGVLAEAEGMYGPVALVVTIDEEACVLKVVIGDVFACVLEVVV
jgi:hypothetical protein